MSYKCEQCGYQVAPRVEQKQVIMAERFTSEGSQIERTFKICPSCAAQHRAMGGRII